MMKWLREHVRLSIYMHWSWWVLGLAVGCVPFDWEDGTKTYYIDVDLLCFRLSLLVDMGEEHD